MEVESATSGMRVSEIFYSLQGEGRLAGVPSVFVRLAGCPLRCRWCDSKYAWHQSAGSHQSLETIVQTVQKWQCRYVVITGGEPMVNPDSSARSELPELVERLKACGKHVTIETAGIAFIPDIACDLMSISPKLSNSTPKDPKLAAVHESIRLDTSVLAELLGHYRCQVKFVVESEADIEEIRQVIEQTANIDTETVMLMPQGQTKKQLLARSPMVARLCKRNGFAFCQRLHILLWGNKRGR